MPIDPRPRRRSLRLPGYDYSQAGAYFITACIHNRAMLFGEVIDGDVRLNDMGTIVQQTWNDLPTHYRGIELDAFMVMPNHVHGIIVLADQSERRHAIPEIVRGFKTFSARPVNEHVRIGVHLGAGFEPALGPPTRTIRWQRGYYEHVIRNEKALDRIRAYVANNPSRWADDPENISRAVPAEAGRV
jgi:putative transposase